MNTMVIDLSHWDPAKDYNQVKASGIVGVIYKSTDFTTYQDPTYQDQKAAAKAAGLKWGSYHFAHPGYVEQQVTNYVKWTSPTPDEIICLDWETANTGTMSPAEAEQWITSVEYLLGRPGQCLIYSGNVAKEQLGSKPNPFFGQRRLWLAQYNTTPIVQASWSTYWLWQFTDGQIGPMPHSVPGVGPCDISSYQGTPEQLAAEWASGRALPAPPISAQVVNITVEVPAGFKVNVTTTERK